MVVIKPGGFASHAGARIIKSINDTQREAFKSAKALGDGHTIDFKTSTEADRVRYDKLLAEVAESTKDLEASKDAEKTVDGHINTLDRIQKKVTQLAPYGTNFTPNTDEQVQLARVQAQTLLDLIANSLDGEVVDGGSIRTVSNVDPGGTANANYVRLSDQADSIDLADGTSLVNPVIPENLKDIIGVAHAILAATNAPNPLGVAFPANVTALFNSVNNALSTMMSNAKANQESAQKSQITLGEQVGDKKDSIDDIKQADNTKVANELSESGRKSEVMQGILAFLNNLAKSAIDTARSIAS